MTTNLHEAARLLDLVSHLPEPPAAAASPPLAQALLGARQSLFLSLEPANARARLSDAALGGFLAELSASRDPKPSLPPIPQGAIATGSLDTFITRRPAARVLDLVSCHLPHVIATGSKTIRINGRLATRVTERASCTAKVITGASTVLYGGPSATLNRAPKTTPTTPWFFAETVERVFAYAPDVRTTLEALNTATATAATAPTQLPEDAAASIAALADRMRGDEAFKAGLKKDLETIALTQVGRDLLRELASLGERITLTSIELGKNENPRLDGPQCATGVNSEVLVTDDPKGKYVTIQPPVRRVSPVENKRRFSDVTVYTTPGQTVRGSPSDVVLFHELVHARRGAKNQSTGKLTRAAPHTMVPTRDSSFTNTWQTDEEFETVREENLYRSARVPPLDPRDHYE